MENLNITTGDMVVTADKNEEYGFDWAKRQMENIASFSKEFIAAARGKVFATIKETHSTRELEDISKKLGFDIKQVNNYIDYAKKEGVITYIKRELNNHKLPMNVVNALPNDNKAAAEVIKEANEISHGGKITLDIIEKAKKNIGVDGNAGKAGVNLEQMMDRGAKMREWLMSEKGYTPDQIRESSDVKTLSKTVFSQKMAAAIDTNFPNWNDFYITVKEAVKDSARNTELIESMNDAVDFFYDFKRSEIDNQEFETDKTEFNALFNAGKIK